jgi:hypothetical protein
MLFAIVDTTTLTIVSFYTDVNPYGGPWGSNSAGFVSLQVPNGADPNGLLASLDGNGNPQITFDQPTLDAWQRQQNQAALDSYTTTREAQANADIQTALAVATGQNDDYTTHLAIVAYAQDVAMFPNIWSQTLTGDVLSNSDLVQNIPSTASLVVGMGVSGGGIPLGTTIAQIQTSTRIQLSTPSNLTATQETLIFSPLPSALNTLAVYRPLYVQIQAIRAQRDADIANFVPPYPDVVPEYPME